jgi:hypothetical protein
MAIQTALEMLGRSRKAEPPLGLPRRVARAMTEFSLPYAVANTFVVERA